MGSLHCEPQWCSLWTFTPCLICFSWGCLWPRLPPSNGQSLAKWREVAFETWFLWDSLLIWPPLSLPLSPTCSEGSQVHVSSYLRERDSCGKELILGVDSQCRDLRSPVAMNELRSAYSPLIHMISWLSPQVNFWLQLGEGSHVRGIQLSPPRLLTHRNGDISDCCFKLLSFREMHLRKGDNISKKPGFGNHWQIGVKCKKRGLIQPPRCLSGKTSLTWFSWSNTMAPPCLSPRI